MRKLTYLLTTILLTSCFKSQDVGIKSDAQYELEKITIPENFDFNTSTTVSIDLQIPEAYRKATISFMDKSTLEGGVKIGTGSFDSEGHLHTTLTVPETWTSIYLESNYLGVPSFYLPVMGDEVELDYQDVFDQKVSVAQREQISTKSLNSSSNKRIASAVIHYLADNVDSNGVPDNLEPVNDTFDGDFIGDVNASFPESRPVPTYNPEYIADGNETDIVLNDDAEVFITYVAEGAGYKNVLGFYKYRVGFAPQTAAEIDTIFVAFPNISNAGAGGNLIPGNKVKLGEFEAGTAIGWVLLQNAWKGSNGISTSANRFYSEPSFNPEDSKNQHNVLLKDTQREIVLLGFEDLHREDRNQNPNRYGSDEDFNDAIFYVTATPGDAINTTNIRTITTSAPDTDEDGVDDNQDEYPNDPNKAFNNYFPSSSGYSSIAFEDLWPNKGDYDFNDVVVNYNVNLITNAENKVVELDMKILTRETVAGFENGLGLMFNFEPSKISSVTGMNYTKGLITNEANGCESQQQNAVVIFYDNAHDNLEQELDIHFEFSQPIEPELLGIAPFNTFVFANGVRGKEIHLPNELPTDLADESLFGNSDDNSSVGANNYYKTSENLPWAINISREYAIPKENVEISTAYKKFLQWVSSNGSSFPDWYEDKEGYRDASKLKLEN
ncbi:LruC domain-containing protein [Sediminitomix flava]|uniref:LruC domain-containing protein n=1 Tax=Sediminitomix flava TaxID=379075 RepID=A0A316A510_SEDFL|nr:LruC domain-containing protein [Sediminitomix flava]PWJ44847.1 LruC domain-containing protein [Sediminitomix flava]